MNAPPDKWQWTKSTWTTLHREHIERIFITLRRECLQVEANDESFQVQVIIDDLAGFLQKRAAGETP
jgi:hypothetical protein